MAMKSCFKKNLLLIVISFFLLADLRYVRAQGTSGKSFSETSSYEPAVFSPIVTATCRAGTMTVKVETLDNFVGVVQSRDHRKPECSGYGENAKVTILRLNMIARENETDYCGVFLHGTSDEFSVAIAVRVHKTLETAKDKFYMITCGKAGFQNTRNETSLVNLEIWDEDEKVQEVIYGREYLLRAHFSRPDGQFGMRVQRCFSFSDTNNTIELVDERGCPDPNIMSTFEYDNLSGLAVAKIYSMFKFSESNRVHFQCDILVCKGACEESSCAEIVPEVKPFQETDTLLQPTVDGALMASYSVFVLEPGEKAGELEVSPVCADCSVTDNWIFWLCVAFGFGFFLLLIIICFLLSAVTCSCVSNELDKDKNNLGGGSSSTDSLRPRKDKVVEEFDPYAKSWHGSQYGSRYSLNGVLRPMPVPYIPTSATPIVNDHSLSSSGNDNHMMRRSNGSLYSSRSRSRRTSAVHQRPRSKLRSKSNHRNSTEAATAAVVLSSSSTSTQYSNANSIGRLAVTK